MNDIHRTYGILRSALLAIVAFILASQAYASNTEATIIGLGNVNQPGSDSIVLQSPDTYCQYTDPIIITVTGKDVTWYAEAAKRTKLMEGNTYTPPPLDKTTIYYLTQTVNGIESSVQAITIEIVKFFLTNVATTPAGCGKNDGTMTITATGGSASYPLQYQLDDGPLQLSPVFTNLSGGTYKLAMHAVNCWGSIDITVDQKPSPIIAAIDSIAPHCGNMDGSLRITAYGGSGSLSYSLNGIDFKSENLFDNLAGGVYTVSVRDESLCVVSQPASLKKSIMLQLNTVAVIPTSCGKPNGQVVISAAEGNGKLTYSLTGRPDQLSIVFDSLEAGSYLVSARDEDGCGDNEVVEVAKSHGPSVIDISTQIPTCDLANGHITITVNGLGSHYYSIDDTHFQKDSSFGGLPAGNYMVTVKDDLDCHVLQEINLGGPCGQQIYIPSSFTPNGDGINDGWSIFFPAISLQVYKLTLFNRWGEVVFHSELQSVNSGNILWDGNYKGGILHGLFSYQLEVQLSAERSYTYRGTVMVL